MRNVITFILLLTFIGCSQNQGTNTSFEETPKEDFSSLKNSELKEAIFLVPPENPFR